jgi:SAM-dependent methyltransferase
MIILLAITLFLSSSLLFLVQPMIAKMVLPLLGGTPAVWNTCMVFFQATLLAGYLYVHAATKWLRPRQQVALHITLLVVSLLALPVVLITRGDPPASGMPVLWLLRVLAVTVGVPFFMASTSSPLLLRWFARTNHPHAQDPYFLSVAANLGSVFALLAYPVAVEPTLRLADQSWLWAVGYGLFVALTLACHWLVYRAAGQLPGTKGPGLQREGPEAGEKDGEPITWAQRLRWGVLAFIPSSLMLGVTTFVTTDIAAVPLFWVLPLTIYLLTFVLVFAKRVVLPQALAERALPLCALVLVTVIVFASHLPPVAQSPVHLLTFFFAAMVCHGELARTRPTSGRLTDFYLSMSIGGLAGGLFNAVVAPLAFTSVLEYPLAIVLACAARPAAAAGRPSSRFDRQLDFVIPVGFGAGILGLLFVFGNRDPRDPLAVIMMYILPSVVCFSFKRRPLRFALSLGALMLGSAMYVSAHERVPYRNRSFFGVHRVMEDSGRRLRLLIHGRIVHGAQSLDESRRREPLTYFHRTGPIGQALAAVNEVSPRRRVAVIGLGIGSLAAYGQPGQRWTFYEIDPTIATLARDERYFTFVRDSAADVGIVLGDARISLAKEPPRSFDLLILDAFSSDAIPVHLITRQALQLYARVLEPNGVLVFHISNRYIELEPVIGDLAADAGLAAFTENETRISAEDERAGKSPSHWVVMAGATADLGAITRDLRWSRLNPRPQPIVWSDDFSNPLALIHWIK